MNKPGDIVQDEHGRILGRVVSRSPLLDSEMKFVKNFLLGIQKERLTEMSKQTKSEPEKCNLVWLAGTIKQIKIRESSGFILLDPGGDTSKYLPCTTYDNAELTKLLSRFRSEDEIKIHGYLRGWSQKKDGVWENKIEVRITAIKSEPPKHATVAGAMDDERMPF